MHAHTHTHIHSHTQIHSHTYISQGYNSYAKSTIYSEQIRNQTCRQQVHRVPDLSRRQIYKHTFYTYLYNVGVPPYYPALFTCVDWSSKPSYNRTTVWIQKAYTASPDDGRPANAGLPRYGAIYMTSSAITPIVCVRANLR